MAPQARIGRQAAPLRPASHDQCHEEGIREPGIHKSKACQQARGPGVRVLDN